MSIAGMACRAIPRAPYEALPPKVGRGNGSDIVLQRF